MTIAAIIIGAFLILLFLYQFIFRVSGTWKNNGDASSKEIIELAQFGPFVSGESTAQYDGKHRYSGYIIGNTLVLHRKDYGLQYLSQQGFPTEVAKQVEGMVRAQLRLSVKNNRTRLDGQFIPLKIEFMQNPARITKQYFVQFQERKFTKIAE